MTRATLPRRPFWVCPIPGCRKGGAGFAAQWQADDARHRHLATGNPEHRQAAQGVAR